MTEEFKSNFIAGTDLQWAWDSSSLQALERCPRYYYYTIVKGYRTKRLSESAHLKFGTIFHSGLEEYDKALSLGQSQEEAIDFALVHVLTESFGWESDHPAKNRDNLVRSVLWYLFEYENDPAETFILANGKPAVELSFRFGVEYNALGTNFMLSGHLDRVVRFGSDMFVMDRKTTGSYLSAHYFNQFAVHTQMSLYTLASRVVFDAQVNGVMIDAAQVMVGFTNYGRSITMRSEDQLDEFLQNTYEWFETAKAYSSSGFWPMNTQSCGNYGGCPFRSVCSQDRRIRDKYLETEFEVRHWNPLEPRNDEN